MVRRSRQHRYRDLRPLILRSFEDCPGFQGRIEVDGKINRIADGLWHDNYWFFIKGRDLPSVRTEQAYVLRLLRQQYDWQQGPEPRDRLVREAETLKALRSCNFANPIPEFICFVEGDQSEPIGMIETAVSGVSLDRFKDRSTLKHISQVAANVHRMDIGRFVHLPASNTRARHIGLRLEEINADLFAEFPLANQVREWITSYLPSDDHTCILHGDLLPQNLLYDWQNTSDSEGVVAVVDWEMAQIGDLAYDLAIVSRGNRKILGVNNGLEVLLDKYAKLGGRKISLADVRVHELLLILHWLEEAWREYQKPRPNGHGLEFYEKKLQSLFRRTVSCSDG